MRTALPARARVPTVWPAATRGAVASRNDRHARRVPRAARAQAQASLFRALPARLPLPAALCARRVGTTSTAAPRRRHVSLRRRGEERRDNPLCLLCVLLVLYLATYRVCFRVECGRQLMQVFVSFFSFLLPQVRPAHLDRSPPEAPAARERAARTAPQATPAMAPVPSRSAAPTIPLHPRDQARARRAP